MKSRAVVMRRVGSPDVLVMEDVELAPLRPDEVRLRTLASAVNHSDLEIRSGNWKIHRAEPFPYVPGLEVVGEIVEVGAAVRDLRVGDRAWTMMQGLAGVRAERDGGYAEHVTVAASTLAPLPKDVDPIRFAALGLAGVTAHQGLERCGASAGKKVLVTGANGGIGSAAVALARATGAEVVAIDRRSARPEPKSADAVLDVVAGPLFSSLVAALRRGGRYCLIGAIGGGDVTFDAWSLLDGITLTGYSTEDLDGDGLRRATRALLDASLPEIPHTTMPLDDAPRAHAQLECRGIAGRVVLVP